MFMLLWQSYQGGRTSIKLSDWFIFSSKHQVSHYWGEEFHSYTILTIRIWLFYYISHLFRKRLLFADMFIIVNRNYIQMHIEINWFFFQHLSRILKGAVVVAL